MSRCFDLVKEKVVLCLADSMAMPRPNVDYRETWAFLLKNRCQRFDFVNLFKRGFTTEDLVNQWDGDSLEFYKPNIVILQIGIVDCSPRYLNRKSFFYKILIHMPNIIQHYFWKFYKKFNNRKASNCDVLPVDFYNNVKKYVSRCVECDLEKVIIISINKCSGLILKKSPLINESIKIYNDLLFKIANEFPQVVIVSPLSSGDETDFVDGYHPSQLGHIKIFEYLYNELND